MMWLITGNRKESGCFKMMLKFQEAGERTNPPDIYGALKEVEKCIQRNNRQKHFRKTLKNRERSRLPFPTKRRGTFTATIQRNYCYPISASSPFLRARYSYLRQSMALMGSDCCLANLGKKFGNNRASFYIIDM